MMDRKGVIIIEGHLQGLSNTRALGSLGIPVVVVDRRACIASRSRFCTKFFTCPDFREDEFADFLIALCEKKGYDGWLLLPSNDHAVFTLSRNRKRLLSHYKFLVPEEGELASIYDKVRLIEIAASIGVPVPKTYQFTGQNEAQFSSINYPVVTRGRFGLDFYRTLRRKAFVAENPSQLHEHIELISSHIPISQTFTQEVIKSNGNNKTISVAVFSVNGRVMTHWMGVKLREHPLRFGTATFAQSVFVEECLVQTQKLIERLNYTGVCEVEFLYDPDDCQYKLIEINARTWLWVGLARSCGVDFAKLIFEYVNDMKTDFPCDYDIGRYWVNPVTDTVYGMLGILKRKVRAAEFLSSRLERNVTDELFYLKDPVPGFFYLLNLIRFFRER